MALIGSREHYDLLAQFEKEFSHCRLDRKPKETWPKGNVYQSGEANAAFLAYRRGCEYGRAVSS